MGSSGHNKKDYSGSFIGEVASLNDPENLMRVRVKVHGLFDRNVDEHGTD